MTENKKPFSITFKLFEGWNEPVSFDNEFDRTLFQKRVCDVVDPDKLDPDLGQDLIELNLRVAAQRARYLCQQRFKSSKDAVENLRDLARACEQIEKTGERCLANGVIDESNIEDARGQVSLHDEIVPMSRKEYARLGFLDTVVYNPFIIEDYPLESVIDAAKIVAKAARKQLLNAKERLRKYSFASRMDSEVIAKSVYDVHQKYGKESVYFPGSNTGEVALLYCELCRLSGVSEGDAHSTLRKFSDPEESDQK